ncbi:MAG: glycosyltransferase family 2 protein [Candidatus Omnitrophica bacterium]|nr:glycosyltransferase family 2 protein [Candidatus Omnitrophota bacterium]
MRPGIADMASTPMSGLARRTVYIVLPAWNEETSLPSLLSALHETMGEASTPYQVIVVDDGSQDRTAEIVETFDRAVPVRLIRHGTNQGLGATIRDGLLAAIEHASDRDVIVTMDADDTHTPGLILRMVRMITEGYEVVVASRYHPESRVRGVPLLRRLLSRGASLVMQALFPTPGVRDFTCGYRAYKASVLRRAVARYQETFVNQEGFQCMVDILLKLRSMNVVFGEAPLILRYDLKAGKSKMDIWHTIYHTCLLLVERRLGF